MSNAQTLPAAPWTTVGRTGLRTTKLGIGTWGFGPIGAPETQVGDDESLVAVLRAAFDAGIRYLDTAESYANEERLGRLLPLAGAPPDLVIATKSGRSGKVTEGFTADHFRSSVENSLRQLRLQKLPLLLIHDPRDEADMAEVLGPGGALEGLRKMQAEGLVQSIGIATGTIGPLWTAVESGEFDVIQMPRLYTLLNTAAKDSGLLAAAKAKNIGTMVPAPFGGNILATGVRPDRAPLYMYRAAIPEVVEAVERMEERCRELGISLPVAALAFVLTEPLVDLTVVGLARPEEVYWNIPACDPGVSRADLESIREAGRIDPVLIGGPDFKPVFAAAQRQVCMVRSNDVKAKLRSGGTAIGTMVFEFFVPGLGNIGRGVARRARGFDMRVLAYEPYPDQAFVREHGVELVPLERLFAESDFVTLHLPASAETARMVNARLLGLMKPSAYLINTARGALVDEDALYDALRANKIAGAALDVREIEPPPDARFNELPHVVLAPHAAGSTPRAVHAAIRAAANAAAAYLRGERPEGVINPEVLAREPQHA